MLQANGNIVMSLPLVLYCDDMSGNVSKKWNKHENWVFQMAGLPSAMANTSDHMHFITTSKLATGYESAEVIAKCMQEMENGVEIFHAGLKQLVRVYGMIMQITGDNPAHAMLCSHPGLRSSTPCRLCDVRWTKERSAVEIFNFSSSPAPLAYRNLHTSMKTRLELLCLYDDFQGGQCSRAAMEDLMKEKGIKDPYFLRSFTNTEKSKVQINPLMGSLDSPTEILHCLLLGVIKYAMRATIDDLSQPLEATLKNQIEGVDKTGLPKPPNGHALIQYVKSLIGKDFRLFAQIAPFALQGIVNERTLALWESISQLTALVYVDQIDDMEVYISDLEASLDILVLQSFESFNALIRQAIGFTNRQNPSRDVAKSFAQLAAVRHIVTGGYINVKGIWINQPLSLSGHFKAGTGKAALRL
ncbi:hypothetical protein DFJ73DRAFT_624150 [Zopfochytrium polystomum]|nr:hypothetical protein DFJ73DRAFT_624150 [Zopfochytrium polystomum]